MGLISFVQDEIVLNCDGREIWEAFEERAFMTGVWSESFRYYKSS